MTFDQIIKKTVKRIEDFYSDLNRLSGNRSLGENTGICFALKCFIFIWLKILFTAAVFSQYDDRNGQIIAW